MLVSFATDARDSQHRKNAARATHFLSPEDGINRELQNLLYFDLYFPFIILLFKKLKNKKLVTIGFVLLGHVKIAKRILSWSFQMLSVNHI